MPGSVLLAGKEVPELPEKEFYSLMKFTFDEPEIKPESITENAPQQFIRAHADLLSESFREVKMSDAMRQSLDKSAYIFSGFKAYHEMKEAVPSLVDENGNRKSFNQFLNDVQKINKDYNVNYLRTEYNFANQSAQMAAKWEQFVKDGDEYWLQYRTAGDDRVREEHAALDGITLPIDDPFWDENMPPNGWNCRCTVVQVRKDKYEKSNSKEAMEKGREATSGKYSEMLRFNPGKQKSLYPDYNSYTVKSCANCPKRGSVKLAKIGTSKNELCSVCSQLQEQNKPKGIDKKLKALHGLSGNQYIKKLKEITKDKTFKLLQKNIYHTGGEGLEYERQKAAAIKAESHGYTVYMLPNPNNTQSGDFIFIRKSVYKLYDLKTITGKASVGNRLLESVGQTNRVLLNMTVNYNPRNLAEEIKKYFEYNEKACEVLVFNGNKEIFVARNCASVKNFYVWFCKLYTK